MAKQKDDQVVIALVENEDTAKEAVKILKKWDKDDKDLKFGNVGYIFLDGDKVKTHLERSAGKGAETGAIIGIIAAFLSSGLTVAAGAVGGGIFGAIAGEFFKKSTNLTKDEVEKIGKSLEDGQVALVVTCGEDEVEPTSAELTNIGATVKSYSF